MKHLEENKRGFCGIGIYFPQKDVNIGTLFRSAYAFGADFLFTIGRKYRTQSSDTCNSTQHVPYYHYEDYEHFLQNRPMGAQIVSVEINDKSRKLNKFCHPSKAVYLLGSESGGLPPKCLASNLVVEIPTKICLNVSTTGSIILYDRLSKMEK